MSNVSWDRPPDEPGRTGRIDRPITTVWQHCGPGSALARQFGIPQYRGYLPIVLGGEEARALAAGEPVEIDPYHLLCGLVLTARPPDDVDPIYSIDVSTRDVLLEGLRRGYLVPSREQVVLDIAQNLMGRFGIGQAIRALDAGLVLEPGSSWIRSDLVMLLWHELAETPDLLMLRFHHAIPCLPT